MKSIEEQTRDAAEQYSARAIDSPSIGGFDDIVKDFEAGSNWERNRDKWISVKDEKPNCVCILVASKGLVLTMNYIDGEYYYGSNNWVDQVTHWMPTPKIPKPPKKEVKP